MTDDVVVTFSAGFRRCSATRNCAQVRLPIAAVDAEPMRSDTIAIGSSVSPHGRIPNTSGSSLTRATSSRGTTSVTSPSRGTTSIVSRSRGMASYPMSHGRSAPTDSRQTSMPCSVMAARTRESLAACMIGGYRSLVAQPSIGPPVRSSRCCALRVLPHGSWWRRCGQAPDTASRWEVDRRSCVGGNESGRRNRRGVPRRRPRAPHTPE
ncbi:unannotated protein [freshwater metagenome]|uniref:Unannotated protein n=1 Tax=freshwater metagenome TaxID=449393 RepID=A0A6J6IDV9_9ZZZZ